jgi:hypothetical protein
MAVAVRPSNIGKDSKRRMAAPWKVHSDDYDIVIGSNVNPVRDRFSA